MPGYSPLLAVFTGIFEIFAAAWALIGPGRKRVLQPIGLLLLLLAGYQFAEVAVCANPRQIWFSRLAFFDTTWLPPLGLWLAYQLTDFRSLGLKLIPLGYFGFGFALNLWIFLDPGCITRSVCSLVIARYSHSSLFEVVYGLFYQSGLALLIFGTAALIARTEDRVLRKHLADLQIGVLGFVLPSFMVRIFFPGQGGVLPSVMCHFALVLALALFVVTRREKTFFRRSS